MNNRKGFTLVEMLVVIAVIGIISTVALTALGPSRNKAKDSRIISGLNQIRAVAETIYDGDYSGIAAEAADPTSEIGKSIADIMVNNGKQAVVFSYSPNNADYSAHSPLASGGNYCVDSAGSTTNGIGADGVCGAGAGNP